MAVEVTTGGAYITGIKEFRAALKAIGPEWPKELKETHEQIGRRGRALSQAQARAMGGVQARAAGAIKSRGNQREAVIYVQPTTQNPMAFIAFWGAKRRTGWYAKAGPNAMSRTGWASRQVLKPQHPPWVGNTWEPAVAGQGPYAINEALAEHLDDLLDQYLNMIDRLSGRAFPEGGNR